MREKLVVYESLSNPELYPMTHALEDYIEDVVQERGLDPNDLDIASEIRICTQIAEQHGEYEHGSADSEWMQELGLSFEQYSNCCLDILGGILGRIGK